jgi:hypothetical protein
MVTRKKERTMTKQRLGTLLVLSAATAFGATFGLSTKAGALPSDQCDLVCDFDVSCDTPCHHHWEDTTCGDDSGVCRATIEQDQDGDGVPDVIDNCPQTSNSDQLDCNEDGAGNACDEPCPDFGWGQ